MSFSFLKTRITTFGDKNIDNLAAESFTKRYGECLANEVILPLIEAWSGETAINLSSAVGESLPKGIVKVLDPKCCQFINRASCGLRL